MVQEARTAASSRPPPTEDEPFRIARRVAVGLPTILGTLGAVSAVVYLDCTSDCIHGGAGLALVSPLTAPFDAALGANGTVERPGVYLLVVLVALGITVVWWSAVARIGIGLADGRRCPRLVFWSFWSAGWVVAYASTLAAIGLSMNIGWVVPSILEGLAPTAVLVIARRVED